MSQLGAGAPGPVESARLPPGESPTIGRAASDVPARHYDGSSDPTLVPKFNQQPTSETKK